MEQINDPEVVGKPAAKTLKTLKVKISTDLPLEKELYRLAEIVVKLRYTTRMWDEHYGATRREDKKKWEEIADKWIDEHVQP